MTQYKFEDSVEVPLSEIHLVEEERQRTNHDVSDLVPSIKARGIYQPIIVDKETSKIVVGARRYLAAIEAGLSTIPVRYSQNLSPRERKIVELEENLRRKNLPWQESAIAMLEIHDLYVQINEEWSRVDTADALGLSKQLVSTALIVAEELRNGNEKIAAASGLKAAFGIMGRAKNRKIEDAMADLAEAFSDEIEKEDAEGRETVSVSTVDSPVRDGIQSPELKARRDPVPSVLVHDFRSWATSFSGVPFNLVHCDFPYGVGIDDSDQGGGDRYGTYSDTPETYWELVKVFCENLNNFMSNSAHLVFWLSADSDIQSDTLRFFAKHAPSLDFWRKPLIWHKTDNRGIVADAQRGPRHVYETALLASRGDRLIVKVVSNCYGAPTDKTFHHSTKSEPMLRHFFSMLVDETTRLLDPTCGSGSALRAAESLGAKKVLGLEINEEFASEANAEMRRFRLLRNHAAKEEEVD